MTEHVFLVPGFFGFTSLGKLSYFTGVTVHLREALQRRGVDANVVAIPTLPTGSIRKRTARMMEVIEAEVRNAPGPIHLIGHSTGGLDARLAVCPTADLERDAKLEINERVRTLVTVATPHFGTPLARAFSNQVGRGALRVGAVWITFLLSSGKLPLSTALKAGRLVTRLDDWVGLDDTLADELFNDLLGALGERERRELADLVAGVGHDHSLMQQLTEAGCDLLNATTGRPENVRYGCVVTRAPRARVSTAVRNFHDVYAQFMLGVYGTLHLLTSMTDPRWLPEPSDEQRAWLERELGHEPTARDNDGVVPTLAQLWGDPIAAVQADHLDPIGHFGGARGQRRSDWFPSGSGFDRRQFERLWDRVADYLVGAT